MSERSGVPSGVPSEVSPETVRAYRALLIFYRYTFFTMSPSDLAPPHSPALEQILPFVRGFTWMWWATATWWIPMLLILVVQHTNDERRLTTRRSRRSSRASGRYPSWTRSR